MTDPGPYRAALEGLPDTIEGVALIVQGMLIHRDWLPQYGITLSAERIEEPHCRRIVERLARICALWDAPLTQPRPRERRSVGTCRDFTVFAVTMLRNRGVPARARCGFGSYFASKFEDHWVVEFWKDGRWRLADVQMDALQQGVPKPRFNLFDVPRDRVLVAGDAWKRWRTGRNRAEEFGIGTIRGASFIAGNVVRDFAALNNMESLPWDVWGPMTMGDDSRLTANLALFDYVAELGQNTAYRHSEIRSLYDADSQLRPQSTVFNAIRQQREAI